MCSHNLILCQRFDYASISFLLLLILISSSTQVRFNVEGRSNPKSAGFSQRVNEEKEIMRSPIGSRPPRCETRCSTCGHCMAIQVPSNPQVNHGNRNYQTVPNNINYARGDGSSYYKPLSWKCKCGNLIFNP